ncbi:MAG: hypothetical protein KA715_05535 [Xanthomonadaceae bacterium]|nr:hypothetical protein [Xanthomonadaceae bacterium]
MNKIIFGGVILVLLAAGSIWAAPQYPLKYSCECIDTGMECGDVYMNMEVLVRSNKSMKFRITDAEGHLFASLESLRDVTKPTKGKNFKRFYHNNKKWTKPFPHLYVEDEILRGGKSGTVKMPEYNGEGSPYTWEYECEKQKN